MKIQIDLSKSENPYYKTFKSKQEWLDYSSDLAKRKIYTIANPKKFPTIYIISGMHNDPYSWDVKEDGIFLYDYEEIKEE